MENEQQMPQNTGVIIDVRKGDFYAGGETGAVAEVIKKDGQWDKLLPDEETQYRNLIDIFACVTFSALNSVEMIFEHKWSNNLFSANQRAFLQENGYISEKTGRINFSDRAIAKLSGTTKIGNSLGAVGDAIRNCGLVPESDWPWPAEMSDKMNKDEKWNLYYREVPEEVKAKGLKFKEIFDIKYQWVVLQGLTKSIEEVLKEYLKYGPLQIASAVCSPWHSTEKDPPIEGCGCTTQHATTIYGFNDGKSWKDFDHYKSYRKLLAWDYCIPYATQYYVSEKTSDLLDEDFRYTFNKNLWYGMQASDEVKKLQTALQKLGYMKKGVFGPFGPKTKEANSAFQFDHGIFGNNGMNFGPQTREAMNRELNK